MAYLEHSGDKRSEKPVLLFAVIWQRIIFEFDYRLRRLLSLILVSPHDSGLSGSRRLSCAEGSENYRVQKRPDLPYSRVVFSCLKSQSYLFRIP
jgi:hypothetical protein